MFTSAVIWSIIDCGSTVSNRNIELITIVSMVTRIFCTGLICFYFLEIYSKITNSYQKKRLEKFPVPKYHILS